ncbi:MAG: MCP four helix bundle domain-containing protein, partial [Bacteroidales bacterium]|nr:MCP four helix bundle domain-containing protein [Bacteroidales bacterium]
MKIKDFKIVLKLQLGFAILLLFVFVLGIVSYFQTRMVYQQTENLYNHPMLVTRAVAKLNEDILHMRLGTRNLMLSVNKTEQQEAIRYIEVHGADALLQFDVIRAQYLGPKEDVEEAYKAFISWETAREVNTQLALAGNIKSVKESVDVSGPVGKLRDQMLAKN